MMSSDNLQHLCQTSVVFGLKLFLRILINYVIIGLLMAIPSYRLGLKPVLAATVFGIVTVFGLYHSTVAYLSARLRPKSRQESATDD
jgi:hypothetical protein